MFDMIMLSVLAVSDLTDIQEQKKKPQSETWTYKYLLPDANITHVRWDQTVSL